MIPEEIKLPGAIAQAQLVADRRGSRIWKVQLGDGRHLALKYATDNQSAQGVQGTARTLAAREAAVLRELDHEDYLFASGETEHGTWLAVAWVDAPTMAQRWRGLRMSNDRNVQSSALAATWLTAGTLAGLHANGWRHADLQADHILVPDEGRVQLIDFALAQGPKEVEPAVAYRGALAHLTAPEVAAEILATPPNHHVRLTEQAEVYMFGAVLFAAWLGQWPFDYGSDPRSLDLDQIYSCICEPMKRRALPSWWPPMASLIGSMLEDSPTNRPTMAEVRTALSGQMGTRQ